MSLPMLRLLIVIFAVVLPIQGFAALSIEETEELRRFGNEMAAVKGTLLTPPIGKIRPEVRQTQLYIERTILELAADELGARGYNLVVNIYGGERANVWVQKFQAGDSLESQWQRSHPHRPWPIRKWLGFANNKPIYEIGITTALLHEIKYDAELKFLLAHELTHLFEGHVEESAEVAQRWLNQQSDEVVADKGGVLRTLGKGNINGALIAMRRLLSNPQSGRNEITVDEWLEAFASAQDSHHHPGLRISILQFLTEYFKRSNPKALAEPLRRLPDFVRISSLGRPAKIRLSGPDKEIAQSLFSKNIWKKGELGTLERALRPIYNNQSLTREFLLTSLESISSSRRSASEKVNAALKMMSTLAIGSVETFTLAMDSLTADEVKGLTHFFAENTSKSNWSYESYQEKRKKVPQDWKVSWDTFNVFMSSGNGQLILEHLSRSMPSWRRYLEALSNLKLKGVESKVNVEEFERLIGSESILADGPLYKEYWRLLSLSNALSELDSNMPGVELPSKDDFVFFQNRTTESIAKIQAKSGHDFGFSDFVRKVGKAMALRYERDLLQSMGDQSLDNSKSIDLATKKARERYSDLDTWMDMAERQLVDVRSEPAQSAYLRYVDSIFSEKTGLVVNRHLLSNHTTRLAMAAAIIENPKYGRESKVRALKFAFLAQGHSAIWALKDLPEQARVESVLTRFLQTFSLAELEQLMVGHSADLTELLKHIGKPYQRLAPKAAPKDPFARVKWELEPALAYLSECVSGFGLLQSLNQNFAFETAGFSDVQRIIMQVSNTMRDANWLINRLYGDREPIARVQADALTFLSRLLITTRDQAPTFKVWYQSFERLQSAGGSNFMLTDRDLSTVREFVENGLSKLPDSDRYKFLKKDYVRAVISSEFLAQQGARAVLGETPNLQDRNSLAKTIAKVEKDLRLAAPDLSQRYRSLLVAPTKAQPHESEALFPGSDRRPEDQIQDMGTKTRALSAMIALVRRQPVPEQIQFLEYLMGRRQTLPDFVLRVNREYMESRPAQGISRIKSLPSLSDAIQVARSELALRSPLERAIVVNSFLAGPGGPLAESENLRTYVDHLLLNVAATKKSVAELLFRGLLDAEGEDKSLVVSYVMAQKPAGNVQTHLQEGQILNALVSFYGAPGIKLAQYLAFLNQFSEYQEHLETYQDSALPPTDLESLKLVRDQLGTHWDSNRFEYVGMIGSGSVNIAIEYLDRQTNESRIVSLLRENIETKTKEDFRRLKKLVEELATNPATESQFDFVRGLIGVIEKSVLLEFDKNHAFEMQRYAERLYNRDVNGWKIRTVKAHELIGKGVFMDKAPGRGARRVFRESPDVYRSAMAALLEVEFDNLKGVDSADGTATVPLIANPDLHDGQVLIDEANRQVTVIDFGQALSISNSEREFAADLLVMISGYESSSRAQAVIERWTRQFGYQNVQIDPERLKSALAGKDRMDVFVRVLALLETSGFSVPLSGVHWVLSANRIIGLGQKIGMPMTKRIGSFLLAKRVGVKLETFNWLSGAMGKMKKRIFPRKIRCESIFEVR
jgi:hypothetical protein